MIKFLKEILMKYNGKNLKTKGYYTKEYGTVIPVSLFNELGYITKGIGDAVEISDKKTQTASVSNKKLIKEVKFLKEILIKYNGKALKVKGYYTKEYGTVIPVSLLNELGYIIKGTGDAVEVSDKKVQNAPIKTPVEDKKTVEDVNEKYPKKYKPLTNIKIVLDAGHGKNYNISPVDSRYCEGNRMLEVVFEAKKLLEQLGAKVVLTRTNDENISLSKRVKIANDSNADYCISCHTNALPKEKQGKAKGILVVHSIKRPNDKLALYIRDAAVKNLGFEKRNNSFIESQVTKGTDYLAMIRGPKMHSVLIEAGFHDNKNDVKILLRPDMPRLYAESIADGLILYIKEIKK